VPTYVAMLRGINVGGKRVAMADLRELVAALGAEDVRTYVQSGNVVFRSRDKASGVVEAIEKSIRTTLGLEVRVLLRAGAQLAKVVEANPFLASGMDPAGLHVTFCAERPDSGRVRELAGQSFEPDDFKVVGREVYLHCPNGYGRTKLNNAFLERKLGVAGTTRNWKTVTTLAELAKA
jgi:uncharacterized protein (DUF1697 family)